MQRQQGAACDVPGGILGRLATSNTNGFDFSFSLACKAVASILGTGGPNNLLRKLMIDPFDDVTLRG
jgi:hypothetical protein